MATEINTAGSPTTTAPLTAAVNAETIVKHGDETPKVMVLAVHKDAAGELQITPIDVEHEDDDQSDLTELETAKRKEFRDVCIANDGAMKKALGAMHGIFSQRLYRAQFRSFENYCFALFGMHRIPAETVTKAKARVKKLKATMQEDAI
jgi:hypothetical protein